MPMQNVYSKKYTILKNFEKSYPPSLSIAKSILSTSKFTRSAFLDCCLNLFLFFFCVLSSFNLHAQRLVDASSIYPFFVSGPLAEQSLSLQIIDIHFNNAASLTKSYVYLRDAEISGANDLISGTEDTWVVYSILSPKEAELMGDSPSIINQISTLGKAETQVSLKMAANQTADGKSILLKRLSTLDALQQADGSYKVRVVALALEGNDVNRFGLFVTEQPTKGLASTAARITTPFLNILDNSRLGNTSWSVKNSSNTDARASIFVAKADGSSNSLNQLVERKSSPSGNWTRMELAEAGSRLIGGMLILKQQTEYFRTHPSQSTKEGIRIYIAQNAKLLDIDDFQLTIDAVAETEVRREIADAATPPKTDVQNQKTVTGNELQENTAAEFYLSSSPSGTDCANYVLTLSARNEADMSKLRQVSWSSSALVRSDKTQATYAVPTKSKSTVVLVEVAYVENNETKRVELRQEIAQNIPPKADGGINRSAEKNEFITFDGTLSEDLDGQIKAYFWDLGDGTKKTGARIEHKYQQTGSYQVVLTVVDNIGGECGISTDTLIVSINKEPVIVLSPDQPSKIGRNQYNVGQSYDEDGQITDITWYLNDKVVGKSPFIDISLTNTDSPLKVVVTDNSFARNRTTERIIYAERNDAPKANAGKDIVVEPGQNMVLQGDATIKNSEFPIVSYEWKLANEKYLGKRVEQTISEAGTYKAQLEVQDSRGFTSTDELTIYVNTPPTARFSITEISGKEVQLSAVSSFDADNQKLRYSWLLGKEKTASGPEVKYKFQNDGTHQISLTVNDGSGSPNATNTFTQEITLGGITDATSSTSASMANTEDELKAIPVNKEEPKPKVVESKLPLSQAKIEGPGSVFVGQQATFTLKTATKTPSAIFWDDGKGIAGDGNQLSLTFNEAGIRQITAIFFEKTDSGTNEQYLTTEVEIIDRRKEDSILEAIVANNRTLIAGRHVQLMLNVGDKADQVFKRKDQQFRKVLYQTQQDANENETKMWKRFTGHCENQSYDLLSYFGLPEELVKQDRLYVFANGKLLLPSTYLNQAIDLSVVSAYEIRIYYPETVLKESEDLVFKHLIKADSSPEIHASVASVVQKDQWKTYSAANSFDADGQVLRYYWEMGDGLRYTGKTIRHQYVHAGSYEVKLIIESGKGLSDCERVEKKWTVEVVGD